MIKRTFFPIERKYSAIAVHLFAPLILSKGDLSAGTATIIILLFLSKLSNDSTITFTSLALSPIKPTTTTSELEYLLIICNRTDLPTPLPAIIPIL